MRWVANMLLLIKSFTKGGNYIFSLKGNQGTLYEDLTIYLSVNELKTLNNLSSCNDHDKGHGRLETRQCQITHEAAWLQERHPHWSSINSLIHIDSTRETKGKTTHETRYYISFLKETPQKILAAIKSHWAIENNLHWVLDMSFGEDQSRIRKENAPQAMAIIRRMALNLLQFTKDKIKRQSIKRLRKMAEWDDNMLFNILT